MEILIIVLILISLTLSVFLFKLKQRNKRLADITAQLIIDKEAMNEAIERLSFVANNSTTIENGFIKFLSESRDSAFNYIEDVQHAIFVLKEKYEDKEDIEQSITELFEMLPDNKEK